MATTHLIPITEQRMYGQLAFVALQSPELARAAKPGQYVLVRCRPAQSFDPLLRRSLLVAGTSPELGQLALLFAPNDRGLAWLATCGVGTQIEVNGPLGVGFSFDKQAQHRLLIGTGAGLAALLFLASLAAQRGNPTMLLLASDDPATLPPPRLLPPEIEYQAARNSAEVLSILNGASRPITWADQIALAVPNYQLAALAQAIRNQRMRWQPRFAEALIAGQFPCGNGACQTCLIETRNGLRTACKDGPVFDLREL